MLHDRRMLFLASLLIGALAMTALSFWHHADTTQTSAPGYRETACQVPVPDTVTVDCGRLDVPENWQDPESRLLSLTTLIFRADDPSTAQEPLIYLMGGPGDRLWPSKDRSLDYWTLLRSNNPWMRTRDLIVFAQRGSDWQSANLFCAPLGDPRIYLGAGRTPKTVQDSDPLVDQALHDCHEGLSARGYDLGAYNTLQNARDVAALRSYLGLEDYNLYGVSYGTQLALTIMQNHPEGLRAVILDAVSPPVIQADGFDAGGFQSALDAVFTACLKDQTCNRVYPDLRRRLSLSLNRLETEQPIVKVEQTATGETLYVRLLPETVLDMIFILLYYQHSTEILPAAIHALAEGDYDIFSLLVAQFYVFDEAYEDFAHGALIAINCNDAPNYLSPARIRTQIERYPLLKSWLKDYDEHAGCHGWPVRDAGPTARAIVTSPIPTLLLAGTLDPVTPPSHAERAAATLPNSTLAIFPGGAHGLIGGTMCSTALADAFLKAPSQPLDLGCITPKPVRFLLPEDVAAYREFLSEGF